MDIDVVPKVENSTPDLMRHIIIKLQTCQILGIKLPSSDVYMKDKWISCLDLVLSLISRYAHANVPKPEIQKTSAQSISDKGPSII